MGDWVCPSDMLGMRTYITLLLLTSQHEGILFYRITKQMLQTAATTKELLHIYVVVSLPFLIQETVFNPLETLHNTQSPLKATSLKP